MFTRELQRLLNEAGTTNISINAVHPGVIDTNLTTGSTFEKMNFLLKRVNTNVETGSMSQVYACIHPDIKTQKLQGVYFVPVIQVGKTTAPGDDKEVWSKFWTWSNDLVAEKGFKGDWVLK